MGFRLRKRPPGPSPGPGTRSVPPPKAQAPGWTSPPSSKPRSSSSSFSSALPQFAPARPWSGLPAVIIGGGPSLKGFNFSLLNGYPTIAVNRAIEFYPSASIWFCLDQPYLTKAASGSLGPTAKSTLANYLGYKVHAAANPHPTATQSGFYHLHVHSADRPRPIIPSSIPSGGNSGTAALCLAIALGASPIHLLGFDMRSDFSTDRQSWFHSGYPSIQNAKVVYPRFLENLQKLLPGIQSSSIINWINPDTPSALTYFPVSPLSKFPARVVPSVYSFHTPEYSPLSTRLRRSCLFFGLSSFHSYPYPSQRSWREGTLLKAHAVMSALTSQSTARSSPAPFLFVDADAEFQRYPSHTPGFSRAPIAARTLKNGTLLSGTLYVEPSSRAASIISSWQFTSAPSTVTTPDQFTLSAVLPFPAPLPDTYCAIFDETPPVPDPVIAHFQASRQFRRSIGCA